jgi:hypothetical protein
LDNKSNLQLLPFLGLANAQKHGLPEKKKKNFGKKKGHFAFDIVSSHTVQEEEKICYSKLSEVQEGEQNSTKKIDHVRDGQM